MQLVEMYFKVFFEILMNMCVSCKAITANACGALKTSICFCSGKLVWNKHCQAQRQHKNCCSFGYKQASRTAPMLGNLLGGIVQHG